LTDRTIAQNLTTVHQQIAAAAAAADRDPTSVMLLAVSKTQDTQAIEEALAAGQVDFGENYLQEAREKIAKLAGKGAIWHYIGAIQANKTRDLAHHFDWIHTVDREKIARRLNDQCPSGKRLNVCLQVNVDQDPNKAGIAPVDIAALLASTAELKNIRVRGLMTILDPRSEPLRSYNRLRELFEAQVCPAGVEWDTLSMGMSGDFEAAIAAGATQVRVGTAVFGPRKPRSP
jgi:pyridoxal phosphate enzyme (YggS family)